MLSGRQDSNLRPPAPKAGAIAGLRYAPFPSFQNKNNTYYQLDNKYLKNWKTNISIES